MIRHLGHTAPSGKRIVLAIAYDDAGILDTITNLTDGESLSSVSYHGKRILRHADAIAAGNAPLDYWKTRAPGDPGL